MPEQQSRVEISFPLKGLEENWSFDQQPPLEVNSLLGVKQPLAILANITVKPLDSFNL